MLLGIPFHAALVFTTTSWLVASPERSAWLEFVPPVLSAFRMPAFFLIAGFFAALLLERRSPAGWLRARAIRLGIPLLTGLILIVPIQDLIVWLGPVGVTHFPLKAEGAVLSHLWFLPVLLAHCAFLAILWPRLSRWPVPDLSVWAQGLFCGFWALALRGLGSIPDIDLAPFGGLFDVALVLEYAPYFLLGVAMRRNSALFERYRHWNWPTAFLGVATLIYSISCEPAVTPAQIVAQLLSQSLAAMCLTQALLGGLAVVADRPIPLVRKLVDASFSIYLVHHPIIVILSIVVLRSGLGPISSWLAICAATLAIAYGIHRLMRRDRIFLFLMNGILPSERPAEKSPALV